MDQISIKIENISCLFSLIVIIFSAKNIDLVHGACLFILNPADKFFIRSKYSFTTGRSDGRFTFL